MRLSEGKEGVVDDDADADGLLKNFDDESDNNTTTGSS